MYVVSFKRSISLSVAISQTAVYLRCEIAPDLLVLNGGEEGRGGGEGGLQPVRGSVDCAHLHLLAAGLIMLFPPSVCPSPR
jgi:hypothetical protein